MIGEGRFLIVDVLRRGGLNSKINIHQSSLLIQSSAPEPGGKSSLGFWSSPDFESLTTFTQARALTTGGIKLIKL